MTLLDVARTDPLTAAPDTPLVAVAAALADHDAEFVVVLEEHQPRGLVTAGTVGRAFGAGIAADATVADAAASIPTVSAAAPRADVIAAFDAGVDAVALVEDDAFAGLLTRDELLATYGRELTDILSLFE